MLLQAKAKNEKSGRLFSGLLKLHFFVVDQRRLIYFSVDIIISDGPLGQKKGRAVRSEQHPQNDTFPWCSASDKSSCSGSFV